MAKRRTRYRGPISAQNQAAKEPEERQLWRAVLARAIMDSCRNGSGKKGEGSKMTRTEEDTAYKLLFSNESAYREYRQQVLFLAGLDPDTDLSGLKARIDAGETIHCYYNEWSVGR